jgi:hypothetical protein
MTSHSKVNDNPTSQKDFFPKYQNINNREDEKVSALRMQMGPSNRNMARLNKAGAKDSTHYKNTSLDEPSVYSAKDRLPDDYRSPVEFISTSNIGRHVPFLHQPNSAFEKKTSQD